VTVLLPGKPGPARGATYLDPEIEAVVQEILEKLYCSSQRPQEAKVVNEIRDRCRVRNLTPPARSSIHERIEAMDLYQRLLSREGRNAAERASPTPGTMKATRPNQIWLIDHTLAEIVLVDRRFRQPLGRPTITLIIDAYTRMCVGCYVSLGSPSVIQTAMALLHAFLPKGASLEAAGQDWIWACHGFPEILHSDNGSDFHAVAIRRGLSAHGILQQFRPPGRPRYGALIERFIGTMMGELHFVPGTTFSNVQARGSYDSERKAVMTLDGFERWVFLQIGRYHSSPHRGLDGFTPQSRWDHSVEAGFTPTAVPPEFAQDLMLSFLPGETRKIDRTGIHFKRLRYWAPWFGPMIRRGAGRVEIRYDPRDLSSIWVQAPTGWERVHLYHRQDPFTLREHELSLEWMREQAKSTFKEAEVHAFRAKARELIEEEARTTKRARRQLEHDQRSIAASTAIFGQVDAEPEPEVIRAASVTLRPSRTRPIVEEWDRD
jgi:putative transposase